MRFLRDKNMILPNRLYEIAKNINNSQNLVDIGTDHGYIPIYCVKNNLAKFAVASDVKIGPVKIAQKNIKKYQLEDKIKTLLSNGFENIEKNSFDTAVIAGMGGLLINEILTVGYDKISNSAAVILQPMIAVCEVRRYLCENGFVITKECLAKEEDKIYNIIVCKKGKEQLSEFDIYVGKRLFEDKAPLFKEHMDNKIYTVTKIIDGLKKTKNCEDEILLRQKELSYYVKARNEFDD